MDGTLALHARLRREQIRLLADNVPALVVGTLVLALGTAALLWARGQPLAAVGGWLAAMVLLCAARLGLLRHFRRRAGAAAERWAPAFVLASGAAGLCWGALAGLFFTPEQPFTLAIVAIVAIVLMSMLSSATQSLGAYFPAHLAFALPCALPFAARCLVSGDGSLATLGALTLVYVLMTELFALRIARAIEDALRLRFENESLVEQLTVAKERAESASLAKTRFLATASHDLRQPIHAMSLFVPALKTLSERPSVSPLVVGTIATRLQAALDTMAQLLSRLLDISRLDAGALQPSPRPVRLDGLLRKLSDEVAQQARAKGLKLRVRVNGTGLAAHTDPAILHTILSNLAGNAVRYTERGGVLLAARRRGERVRVEVWDSGIGISAEDLPRITEEFFQTDSGRRDASQSRGFGLGLAIAKRSAELLGSSLSVRSRPGRGSVFSIELPLAPVAAPAEDPDAPAAAQTRPRRVLVVDNDEQILTAMSYLLRGWGHEPLLAASMADVLGHLEAGAAPELALIDLHLASEEHGLQVAERLRERLGPRIRLAIVTGDTGPEALASICAAGVTGLHKPVDPERLLRFIDEAAADGARAQPIAESP